MFRWIARKYHDCLIALTIVLAGRSLRKAHPMVRGKILIQDAHEPEQKLKIAKGYKLIAVMGILVVPDDDKLMTNGQLTDVIGAIVPNDESFPMITMSAVASYNIIDKTKGKELGNAFGLDVWKF